MISIDDHLYAQAIDFVQGNRGIACGNYDQRR